MVTSHCFMQSWGVWVMGGRRLHGLWTQQKLVRAQIFVEPEVMIKKQIEKVLGVVCLALRQKKSPNQRPAV